MKLAVMAIGLPGSGKTTLLKPFANQYGFVYISRDDIRQKLFNDPLVQKDKEAVWQEADRRMREALTSGKGVVLDSMFVEAWKRKDAVAGARSAGVDRVVGIFFDVDLELAKRRNQSREHVVNEEAFEWLAGQLAKDPPSVTDGFDALYTNLEELEKQELS